jgi:orotate phosphoribosyltransferase
MVISPSRDEVGIQRRREILNLIIAEARLRGDFTLSSGRKSTYYWDGKMATTMGQAALMIAEEILERLEDTEVEAVGGRTIGGACMAPVVAAIGAKRGRALNAFVVRDTPKPHGTRKMIEGQLPRRRGAKVAVLDDVITSGESMLKTIEEVEKEGCEVVKVIVLLDRHEGGSDRLKKAGLDFEAILDANAQGEVTVAELPATQRDAEKRAVPA